MRFQHLQQGATFQILDCEMNQMKSLIQGSYLQGMPTSPDIVRLVHRGGESISKSDMTALIMKDPVLMARVLASANLNPLLESTGDVLVAASRVGDQIYRIAEQASLRSVVSTSLNVANYWTICRWRAKIMMCLNDFDKTGISDTEAYSFALLSDIGFLCVMTDFLSQQSEVSDDLINASQSQSIPTTKVIFKECGVPSRWYSWIGLALDARSPLNALDDLMITMLRVSHEVAQSWLQGVSDELSISRLVRMVSNHLGNKTRLAWVSSIIKCFAEAGHEKVVIDDHSVKQNAVTHPETNSAKGRALRCTLVGFDEGMASYLESILTQSNVNLTTQATLDFCSEMVLYNKVDCIILNGTKESVEHAIGWCSAVRKIKSDKQVYILAVTSDPCEVQVMDLLNAGADDVLDVTYTGILPAKILTAQRWLHLQTEITSYSTRLKSAAKVLLERNEQLEWQANTDVLTGVSNRRHAIEILKRESARACRHGRSLSVALIDLDDFKKINDHHGHDAGDVVLVHAAEMFTSVLRCDDHLSRIGGEEFLVIMPETDAAGAKVVAERLRDVLREKIIKSPTGNDIKLTASIGCAAIGCMKSADAWQELMTSADRAMYSVKRSTKNAVRVVSLK